MIQTNLPDGPASPLVRGFAACLSSVTELALAELPEVKDLPVAHALASWKSWLAGRDFGMVPIVDPRSFQWAGWWIAVVDHSDSPLAEGLQQQVAVLAFGTPPGIVLSPQDPTLLGRATADLPISSAYAVASLNPVLPAAQEAPALTGVVELLAIAPLAEAAMQLVDRARALAGRGLDGDRYADGEGTFSPRGGHRPGYELTLIAAEVVEELTAREAAHDFTSTRRNILTRGVASTPSSAATSGSATSTAKDCASPNPAPTSNASRAPDCSAPSSTAADYAPTSSTAATSPRAARSAPRLHGRRPSSQPAEQQKTVPVVGRPARG